MCQSILLALAALSIGTAPPDDVIRFQAKMPDSIPVGRETHFAVKMSVKDGWSETRGGLQAAILQVEPPRSVELIGRYLRTTEELMRNEYLRSPFERLMSRGQSYVDFVRHDVRGSNAPILLSLTAYVADDRTGDVHLVRRYLSLDVKPAARGEELSQEDFVRLIGEFGRGDEIQIGTRAVPFELPRADGTRMDLRDYLGDKIIVLVAYRNSS